MTPHDSESGHGTVPMGYRPPSPSGARPRRLGPYRLVSELGRGGMGLVYEATLAGSDRRFAVKTILGMDSDDPEAVVRFRREAELLARLAHRNIVRVRSADFESRPAYLVQDMLPGGSLHDRLRKGPLPVEEAVALIATLADALDCAHGEGILHRDLKPQNVLFNGEGEACLVDFGLARDLRAPEAERLTQSGDILGSPAYMAPEQAESGVLDERTDVYGLGAVLYAALTGRGPFRGTNLHETLRAVVEDDPTRPSELRPEVPPGLEAVCLRALAKKPEDRYAGAAAMGAAMGAAMRAPPAPTRRWPLPAAVVVALAAGAVAFSLTHEAKPPPPTAPAPTAPAPTAPVPPRSEPEPAPREERWRLAVGDVLGYLFTRNVDDPAVQASISLYLSLEVREAPDDGPIVLGAQILRARCWFAGPLWGEYGYDSNYPQKVRDQTAFNETDRALDVILGHTFTLEVAPSTGEATAAFGLAGLRDKILGRLPNAEPRTADSGWTRDDGVRLCADTFRAANFKRAWSELGRADLTTGEVRSNAASFDAGRLRWAVRAATRTLVGAELPATESLYPAEFRIVRSGDNLTRLAAAASAPLDGLCTANDLGTPHRIRAGNTLLVPPPVGPDGAPTVVELRRRLEPIRLHRWGVLLAAPRKGRRFVCVEESSGWLRIVWGGGYAWVRAEGVLRVPEATMVQVVDSKPTTSVRGQPVASWSEDVGYTRSGRWHVERSRDDGWVEIQYDDRSGWLQVAQTKRP